MNPFESLCRLASNEEWCWNLYCTTCGHMHFRYSFAELTKGKSPEDSNWLVHNKHPLSHRLGRLPRDFTTTQRDDILHICSKADLVSISKYCTFPDWLGYLGLVIGHMSDNSDAYRTLSSNWASQLRNMVDPQSTIHARLKDIENGYFMLSIQDLESCESMIDKNHIKAQQREDKKINEELDDSFVRSLLLRQYSDFFTTEERESFDDEEIQYELFLNLLKEEGKSVCELEWDSGAMAGESWIKKIGNYFYVSDEIELYGPFGSLNDALENTNTCSYISDATIDIYIRKPVGEIDWVIVAKDGHELTINTDLYLVKNRKLLKL